MREGRRTPGSRESGRRADGDGRREGYEAAKKAGWGRVARRGAATVGAGDEERRPGRGRGPQDRDRRPPRADPPLRDVEPGSAAAAWREASSEPTGTPRKRSGVRREAVDAVERGSATPASAPERAPGDGATKRRSSSKRKALTRRPGELLPAPKGPANTKGLAARLEQGAQLFDAERFRDARKLLDPLVELAPASADLRELDGLVAYREGRWKDAVAQLEAFRSLTHSTEQHPVLADCYRALGRHDEVAALWDELRADSPSADLVTEGRIVVAGSTADQGDLAGAISLLSQGFTLPKRAKEHHLRRAYALADLYERAGEVPRARELFGWVRQQDGGFADVAERLSSLR